MKTLFKLFIPLIFLGCATGQLTNDVFAPIPPQEGKAIVYIYRPYTPPNSANFDVPLFTINGKKIGPLQMSGYYAEYIEPGEIKVEFTHNGAFGTKLFLIKQGSRKPVFAEKNQSYFLRLGATGIGGGEYKLLPVEEDVALKEIKDMKLMSPEFKLKNL